MTPIADLTRLVDDALDAEHIHLAEPARGRLIRRLAELLADADYEFIPSTTAVTPERDDCS